MNEKKIGVIKKKQYYLLIKSIIVNLAAMDEFDKKILDFLQKNAKLTAKELSNSLSLSQTPIYERIKKLEKLGVIKDYVAILDADIVNKGFIVFMNITIKEHSHKSRKVFIDKLSEFKDVAELYHTSGSYDFLAKVRFANVKEYRDFLVDHIATVENISDIDSQIVLEEIKSSTYINL
ncbi:MAG: Lrp/AsnC family transcriptional regulator [Vicingus serpentipes]|nr:Lrp/AsnC family transcriptional regulator [Vicingus serpentipes]